MTSSLTVPAHCRVIIDNDWSGDPDGLVALAHHLLSPANEVVLVTSSRLPDEFSYDKASPEAAAEMARELVALVGASPAPPVVAGSATWFAEGASSGAADAIVEAAGRDSDLPLLLVCAGPLTNVAQALSQDPSLASRLELVWVGGSMSGSREYNHDADPAAADFVFTRPGLVIRQFPLETYRRVACSVAELEHDLGRTAGPVGRWLWDAFVSLPLPDFVTLGGTWSLGDSCPLAVTALSGENCEWATDPSEGAGADVMVCTSIDARLLLADMLARFRLHAEGPSPV
jgi:purine nucleosidase